MKTLDEIKEEVNKLFDVRRSMNVGSDTSDEAFVNEVAKRYATEVATQALKDAAENAEVDYYDWDRARVDKESITNTEIKL